MSPLKCGIDLIFTSKKNFFLFFGKILGPHFLDWLLVSLLKCGIDLIFTSENSFFIFWKNFETPTFGLTPFYNRLL
jgi:hypothetical protein